MLIHKYIELKRKIDSIEQDLEQVHYKNNYSAGTRLRHDLQEIRAMCFEIRSLVQAKRKYVKKK